MAERKDSPVVFMISAATWESWLEEHQFQEEGVWVPIAKKGTSQSSVTYDEALDLALCFGWIDGQKKSLDDKFFLQRFTHRRKGSLWSRRNVSKVESLMKAGRMRLSGLAEVQAAQADGRWENAYDTPRDMVVPQDFLDELSRHPRAAQYYATLGKMVKYTIGLRLQTAKTPKIRSQRIDEFISRLDREESPKL